jgi:DDE superfamily endonuclease
MDGLSPNTFKKMFRVDRETFDEVMERITPFVKVPNEVKAFNSSGGPITLKTRLAVSLRWLAGGSYLDLCFAWGIAFSTFYHPTGVLWPTLEAIDKAFPMGFPVQDISRLEELATGFSEHSSGILDGCVLALDGFGVPTRQPFDWEVERPRDYRFRKGGFAIIVLAGCDSKARFICASCSHSGSTNDIIAWQDSELFEAIEVEKLLPMKYFVIGDEAFNCTNQMLSPWPGKIFFTYLILYYILIMLF